MDRHEMREKNRRSIAGRNIKDMVFLALFLILGTCLVAGQLLYHRDIEIYTDYTYSYARLIAENISGIAPTKFMETQEKDDEYYDIRYSLMTAGIYSEDFKDVYLVIPTEEDLIYISEIYHNLDEDDLARSGLQAGFLEHRAYGPGEKEIMMRVLAGIDPTEEKLYVGLRQIDEKRLATALVPIHSIEPEIPALVGVDISIEAVGRALLRMYVMLAVTIVLITGIGIFFHFRSVDRNMIRPVLSLKQGTDELVARLDREEPFVSDIHTGDELEALGHSVEQLDRNLKHYIRENTAITAERERLSTELALARRIQEDMLPCIFPAFPDRSEFDIYARMDPAKEVGGDFYDFFLIDHDHLGLVIADVSGKGIPAALFMMMVKIMVQNCALAGLSPKQTMEQVNKQIADSNSESMFVTVWLGILDIRSGVVTAVNAGHEYPMLKGPGGSFALIKDRHGIAVGAMEEVRYREYELQLKPGSSLFVYTDGLPEATDRAERLFGTERVLRALNEEAEASPEKILRNIDRAVDAFVGDAPQFDDLTMMCLSYRGPDGSAEGMEEEGETDHG